MNSVLRQFYVIIMTCSVLIHNSYELYTLLLCILRLHP